jgi:DNA invertase Pin-like site-specific DNA recombinase
VNEPLRAVIYTRVSSGKQVEGTSLAEQLIACQKTAENMGAVVVSIRTDPGVSGALYMARPGVQDAIGDIESGRANLFIAYNLFRYSRDREHQSAIKKRVDAAGGRIVFSDMIFEATPEGDLQFGIMGSFGAYERDIIRTRTMKGSHRRAKGDPNKGTKGVQPARTFSPYGYHIVTTAEEKAGLYADMKAGEYVIVEHEARYVREIWRRYSTGDSLRNICEWLNAEGVPTPKGGTKWRPPTMRCLLRNPVYKGEAAFGRTQTFHDESRVVVGKADKFGNVKQLKSTAYTRLRKLGEVSKNEGAQLSFIEAPALVDAETWEACLQKLETNKELKGGNPERAYMLSGILRCDTCGRGLCGHTILKGKRTYYTCNSSDIDGSRHPKDYYPRAMIEDAARRVMEEVLLYPESIAGALRAWEQRRKHEAEASRPEDPAQLQDGLAQLQRKEDATIRAQVEAMAAGRSTSAYVPLLDEIDGQKKALEARLNAALEAAKTPVKMDVDAAVASVTQCAEALREVLYSETLTNAEKKQAVCGFVERMRPLDDGVEILFRPFTTQKPNGIVYTSADLDAKPTLYYLRAS